MPFIRFSMDDTSLSAIDPMMLGNDVVLKPSSRQYSNSTSTHFPAANHNSSSSIIIIITIVIIIMIMIMIMIIIMIMVIIMYLFKETLNTILINDYISVRNRL